MSRIVLPQKVPAEAFKAVEFDPEGAEVVTVSARSIVHVAVVVESAGRLLAWDFKSENGDVGFQLSFAPKGTPVPDDSAGSEVAIPLEKVGNVVPEVGSHECSEPGTYVCSFDNSTSWVSSRTVSYRVYLEPEMPVAVDNSATKSMEVVGADAV
jgi:hypothetical protein